jgi:hypothetical protein
MDLPLYRHALQVRVGFFWQQVALVPIYNQQRIEIQSLLKK